MKTPFYTSIFLVLCSFLLLRSAAAQTIVQGRITDKSDKQAVIGATVIEQDKDKRTVTGVSTDINGNFAIRISNTNNKLVVSSIGYKTFTSGPIGKQTTINVVLEPSASSLGEVNITASKTVSTGGLNISKRNSTAATATLNAKDVEDLAVSSIDQALQGRLSGVDFGTTSGDPGAGMSIRIRGTSSITGNANPMIVLDGMPYETEIPADFNFGTADDQGYAQLLNIAPSDIKDITVLKDAATTALWGSRAANGVLIINTKRGTIGKPVITYNFKGSVSVQPNPIPLLSGDQYSMLIPEEFMNATGVPLDFLGNSGQNKAFQYDPSDPFYYYNYSNNTDWAGLVTRNGTIQDHNMSISGGGEKARYYASVGYYNNLGTTVGTALNRLTSKINLDYIVSEKLRFRTDLTYTHVVNNLNYSSGIRDIAFRKMPNMSPYLYDEYGTLTSAYFSPESNIQGKYSSTYNPLAMANEGSSKLYGERITPKFSVIYDVIPNVLQSTFDVQFDINNTKSKTFLPQIATGRPSTDVNVNRATDNDGDSYNIASKFNLIYTPRFNSDKHQLSALMSFQTNESRSASYGVTSTNTASSYLQDPSVPSLVNIDGLNLQSTQGLSRDIGLLAQAQYEYLDRYIISLNARMDGNSKFGPDNRYGIFPGISGRWRVSGEPFMKKTTKFIDELSVRFSYGASGKAPGGSYFNTYKPLDWSYAGRAAIVPTNMELSSLKWETVVGKNLGFNLVLLKNRITLDAEIYQNTTKDMYYPGLNISTVTGFNKIDMNVGTMDNDGWELSLYTVPLKTKDWTVNFDFNIARNTNSMRSISDFYPRESSVGVPAQGNYKSYLILGNPFGSYYGFKFKGVYKDKAATVARDQDGKPIIGPNGQTIYMRYNYPQVDYVFQPGDAMYEDVNKDGNIDYMDMVYLGNGVPKFVGGFGPTISYKGGIKLSVFFSYRLGYQIVNLARMNTTRMYNWDNQSAAVLSRWRKPGDITNMPRALYNEGYNWLGSDRYVEDASFYRLSAVNISYSLKNSVVKRLRLSSLRFNLTGQNLFTWTKYTGQNPDVNTAGSSNPFSYPKDNALTPLSRTFTLGVTAGF
ncbi:TonB-linked SusC/RagA family outer membrane protein [Mucilaginibacter yixingensis]|uniref:TonB-linked SusC/RagA family outer membrane protein n=1 Tax=Mucilaginibacter yixingensis TaxID=1295612 RepID=A0A2T5JG98_9SPHI|nr:SusC/RagA family TonB-linked outer membrane protein [Mucilaginibacter yixingensis]PTR01431.1 TonB-linked SusC/RagA family outer membrane protein [Mucilaginibacter yixingensis]